MKDPSPAISVVMSTYNDEDHLADTIESILAQEDVDLELIIVNDGSTERTSQILERYAVSDTRVRVVNQENRGLTEALIRGCRAARGRYIARQDAGDLSDPRRLAEQQAALDAHPTVAFVCCQVQYVGPEQELMYSLEDSGLARAPVRVIRFHERSLTLLDGPIHHGAVMFRKDCYDRVGGYRPEFYLSQDRDLWFRLAEVGDYLAIPSVLYKARVVPSGRSLSHRRIQHRLGDLAREALICRLHGESESEILMAARVLRPVRERATSRRTKANAYYFIAEALRRNYDDRCVGYYLKSLLAFPLLLRSWIRLLQWRFASFRNGHKPSCSSC